jgi:HPt (histidine-containing phosphotransfer) domain-containing protein
MANMVVVVTVAAIGKVELQTLCMRFEKNCLESDFKR